MKRIFIALLFVSITAYGDQLGTPVHIGVDGATANNIINFAKLPGQSDGFQVYTSQGIYTEPAGTYTDNTMGLGMFTGLNSTEAQVGIGFETKWRSDPSLPFQSEWYSIWSAPGGMMYKRPYQWNVHHDTGLVQHSMLGRVEWQSSYGQPQITKGETGTLAFVGGDQQITFGGNNRAAITGVTNGENVDLYLSAGGTGNIAFSNQNGNLMQFVSSGTPNGYLQVYMPYFSGYQRHLLLAPNGSVPDIGIDLFSKGQGAILLGTNWGYGGEMRIIPGTVEVDAQLTIPALKATSGTRFVCVDTVGKLVSQAAPCSGT